MNRGLTIRAGQCHVIATCGRCSSASRRGEIDPSFVITHRMNLDDAPQGYDMFNAQGGRLHEVRAAARVSACR